MRAEDGAALFAALYVVQRRFAAWVADSVGESDVTIYYAIALPIRLRGVG